MHTVVIIIVLSHVYSREIFELLLNPVSKFVKRTHGRIGEFLYKLFNCQ